MTLRERAEDCVDNILVRGEERWTRIRCAAVFNDFGFGGSGTFLRAHGTAYEGETLVATARHVVLQCAGAGDLTIGALWEPGHLSIPPSLLVSSLDADSALVVVAGVKAPHLCVDVPPEPRFSVDNGAKILLVGRPLALRPQPPNRSTRGIPKEIVVCFSARATSWTNDGFAARVFRPSALPQRLGGMSGGGAYVVRCTRRSFYGVVTTQNLQGDESIISLPRAREFHDLVRMSAGTRDRLLTARYPRTELRVLGVFKKDPSIAFAGELRSNDEADFPYLLRVGRTRQVVAEPSRPVGPDLSLVERWFSIYLQSSTRNAGAVQTALNNAFEESEMTCSWIQ